MSKDKEKRIITSNPKANEMIANMTDQEYKEWSKPYLAVFDEEFEKEVNE